MNRCVKILPLVAIFFTLSANADVQLKDNSEILGKWNLHDEAVSLTSPKKAVTQEWEFKADGTLISSCIRCRWTNQRVENCVKIFHRKWGNQKTDPLLDEKNMNPAKWLKKRVQT